jgi:hypothetical protein
MEEGAATLWCRCCGVLIRYGLLGEGGTVKLFNQAPLVLSHECQEISNWAKLVRMQADLHPTSETLEKEFGLASFLGAIHPPLKALRKNFSRGNRVLVPKGPCFPPGKQFFGYKERQVV